MPNETAAEQAAAAALKGKSHGVPDGSVRVGADAQTSTPVDAAAATETEAATKAQSRRKRKRKPKVQEVESLNPSSTFCNALVHTFICYTGISEWFDSFLQDTACT